MEKFTLPQYKVIKYLRDKNRNPYGVLVGVKNDDGKVTVKFSLCRKGDKFNKNLGLQIAFRRAEKHCRAPLPRAFRGEIIPFENRVLKYFKINKDDLIGYFHPWL